MQLSTDYDNYHIHAFWSKELTDLVENLHISLYYLEISPSEFNKIGAKSKLKLVEKKD